jgi:N-methylhydantoinase A
MRYRGQRFTLNIPYRSIRQAVADFNRAHRQRFGHALEVPVELVNLRVALSTGRGVLPAGTDVAGRAGQPLERAAVIGERRPVPVWRREDLDIERTYKGPILVLDAVASTYVARGWTLQVHRNGCLLLERS